MRPPGGPVAGAFRFSVRGMVQGVGFRYSAVRIASSLGLEGWVRNEADGRVTGFAQGSEASLAEFASWLERGPAGARVEGLSTEKASPLTGLSGFALER